MPRAGAAKARDGSAASPASSSTTSNPSNHVAGASSSSTTTKKRKRVSRACDQCFAKKDRCDGGTPVCSYCRSLDRECTYLRPERKRGPTQGLRPKLETRIAALETVIGYVLSSKDRLDIHDQSRLATALLESSDDQKAAWRDGWTNSRLKSMLDAPWSLTEDLVQSDIKLGRNSHLLQGDAKDGSSIGGSPHRSTPSQHPSLLQHQQRHAGPEQTEELDSESDYSEVDLAMPPLSTSLVARHAQRGRESHAQASLSHLSDSHDASRTRLHHHSHNHSHSHIHDHDHERGHHHNVLDSHHRDEDGDHDLSSASSSRRESHSSILPLLSSGKGGSSLNRGLVPKGTDPNAALGGFQIEFGGNEDDEHWVRDFMPPANRSSHPRRS